MSAPGYVMSSSMHVRAPGRALLAALFLCGCRGVSATAPTRAAPRAAPVASVAAAPPPAPVAALPFRLPCAEDDLIGCINGCTDRQVEDCVTLGAMYLKGALVSVDVERATGLLRGACSEGSARGCLRLAEAHRDGLIAGEAAEEAELYRRACEAGANLGCLAAGRAYLSGHGVGVDPVFAAALFRRVCDRGNALACVELARLHAQGDGVPRDSRKATELFTKACKLGLDEGCLLASRSGEILPPRD